MKNNLHVFLGATVADAAARPLHWVYNQKKLNQFIKGKKDYTFLKKNRSPFYNIKTGNVSGYNDVGQVMFGKAMFMTADAPLTYLLRGYKKEKWVNADTECESGCGILPFDYQGMIYTHALQWAIGLEIFLLSKDPWRIVLSTDHPNGGSFANYPLVIKLIKEKDIFTRIKERNKIKSHFELKSLMI